jgi:hypothetical protein
MNESITPARRVSLALKRLGAIFVSRARRAFGSLLALVLHDQLGDLSRQTQRLSSASVESVAYVGNELRALDARLSRIERELAALRKAIGDGEAHASSSLERPDEVTSGPRSG